jgi:hypothetical protein
VDVYSASRRRHQMSVIQVDSFMTAITKKYFVRGLVIDAIFLGIGLFLVAASYEGRCSWGMMSTSIECSFFYYLTHDAVFLVVLEAPLVLLALMFPPLIGYQIGRDRSRDSARPY